MFRSRRHTLIYVKRKTPVVSQGKQEEEQGYRNQEILSIEISYLKCLGFWCGRKIRKLMLIRLLIMLPGLQREQEEGGKNRNNSFSRTVSNLELRIRINKI